MASRVPVNGTTDARRRLWLRLKNTCKQFNLLLNQSATTLAQAISCSNVRDGFPVDELLFFLSCPRVYICRSSFLFSPHVFSARR